MIPLIKPINTMDCSCGMTIFTYGIFTTLALNFLPMAILPLTFLPMAFLHLAFLPTFD